MDNNCCEEIWAYLNALQLVQVHVGLSGTIANQQVNLKKRRKGKG